MRGLIIRYCINCKHEDLGRFSDQKRVKLAIEVEKYSLKEG
jgi:hypothetical protein